LARRLRRLRQTADALAQRLAAGPAAARHCRPPRPHPAARRPPLVACRPRHLPVDAPRTTRVTIG